VMAEVNQKRFNAMTNIGFRPTIDGKKLTIETHIFDFEDILYEKELVILFIERIRDERKFSNLQELVNQLEIDKIDALNLLNHLQ